MTTHVQNGECARCQYHPVSLEDLEAHLRSNHAMAPFQATREAALTMKTNGNGHAVPAPPEIRAEHVCPKCETVIPCDLQAAAQLDAHATRLRLIAAKMRERAAGTLGKGKRLNQAWTNEQARELVAAGMSFRAAGKLLHANGETIKRAVTNGV